MKHSRDIFAYLWFAKSRIAKMLSLSASQKRVIISLGIIATVTLFRSLSKKRAHGKALLKTDRNRTRQREIPVPRESLYPYVGHLFSLGDLPAQKIAKWHHELGPIVKIHVGVRTWISVSDRNLAHKIFVTNGAKTSYRPHSTYAYYYCQKGDGIGFAQPGAGWRESRLAVLSTLMPSNLEQYMDAIQGESRKLVNRLLTSTISDGFTDPHRDLELYALNIITTICFGKQFESVDDPEFVNLTDAIEASMKLAGVENDLSNFLPLLKIVDYLSGTRQKMKRFLAEKRDPLISSYITEAENRDQPNMARLLNEKDFNMTMEEKVVLMFDLVGGGTDTISTTLYWNLALMCKYPEVQETAANEIDKYIKNNNGTLPAFKDRLHLPYCVAVIKECMRFKPTTAFGLPHANREAVEVDGYVIPKNTTLITNMKHMHADSSPYHQPERFDPQRFMQNQKTMQAAANGKIEERDHFNFGWGRRICPAVYLAEVELFSAFIHILSKCLIEPIDEKQMPDVDYIRNIGVNVLPAKYKVKFTKRI